MTSGDISARIAALTIALLERPDVIPLVERIVASAPRLVAGATGSLETAEELDQKLRVTIRKVSESLLEDRAGRDLVRGQLHVLNREPWRP